MKADFGTLNESVGRSFQSETERKDAERNWLDKHPPIKPKSNEEREKLALRMCELRRVPS